MPVYGLDHVQLAMPQGGEEEARHFYRLLLGMQEIAKPGNLAARGGVWFRCGSIQLHLGVESGFQPARKAHPAFLVDDLPVLIRLLEDARHEIIRDPEPLPGFDRVFTRDPFGNRIELLQIAITGAGT